LILSLGILKVEVDNPRWRPLEDDWREIAPHLAQDAWEEGKKDGLDSRLNNLQRAFEQRYNETFRGIGVDKLYETVGRDIGLPDRHVAEICDTLENWMFQQWLEGTYSVSELETFLDDLLESLNNRVNAIPSKVETVKSRLVQLYERIDENNTRFAKVGIIGRALNRPGDIFNAQTGLLTEAYHQRTLIQAWNFAEKLLRRVTAELRDRLRPEVADFRVGLSSVNDFFRRRIEQTCQDSVRNNIEAANVVKFFEPAGVRRFCRSLLEQEQWQRSWAGTIRRAMVESAKEHKQRMSGREKHFAMLVHHSSRHPMRCACSRM